VMSDEFDQLPVEQVAERLATATRAVLSASRRAGAS